VNPNWVHVALRSTNNAMDPLASFHFLEMAAATKLRNNVATRTYSSRNRGLLRFASRLCGSFASDKQDMPCCSVSPGRPTRVSQSVSQSRGSQSDGKSTLFPTFCLRKQIGNHDGRKTTSMV
jgi:hypothetical protein